MFLMYRTPRGRSGAKRRAKREGRAAEVGYQEQRGLEVAGALSKGRGSALILGYYFTRNPRSVRLPNGRYAHTFISGEVSMMFGPEETKKGRSPANFVEFTFHALR